MGSNVGIVRRQASEPEEEFILVLHGVLGMFDGSVLEDLHLLVEMGLHNCGIHQQPAKTDDKILDRSVEELTIKVLFEGKLQLVLDARLGCCGVKRYDKRGLLTFSFPDLFGQLHTMLPTYKHRSFYHLPFELGYLGGRLRQLSR